LWWVCLDGLTHYKKSFKRYVSQKNRINEISEKLTCCQNKCINSTISNGTCKAKKGFIRICEGILVKYHLAKEKGFWKLKLKN